MPTFHAPATFVFAILCCQPMHVLPTEMATPHVESVFKLICFVNTCMSRLFLPIWDPKFTNRTIFFWARIKVATVLAATVLQFGTSRWNGWMSEHFETDGSFEDSVLTTADVFPIIAMDGWRIKNRMVKCSFRVHLIGLMEQYGAEATQTPDETTNSLDNTRHSQCQSHSILASLETSANHCCNVSRKPLRMAGIKMLDGTLLIRRCQ